jgi:hypothetical protein
MKGTIVDTAGKLEGTADTVYKTAVQTAKSASTALEDGVEGVSSVAEGLEGALPEIGEGLLEGAGELGAEEGIELSAGLLGGPIGEGIALAVGLGTAIVSGVETVKSIASTISDNQSKLTQQASKKIAQIKKPTADLTGSYVAPNQSAFYNQSEHFSGF